MFRISVIIFLVGGLIIGAAAATASKQDPWLHQLVINHFNANPSIALDTTGSKISENKLHSHVLKAFLKAKKESSCQNDHECPITVADQIGKTKILRLVHLSKDKNISVVFTADGRNKIATCEKTNATVRCN